MMSPNVLNSWAGQAVLLGFLLAQNVSHALLIQISRSVPPHMRYFTSTAVLMGEVFKFFGSLACVLFTTNFRQVWQFFTAAKSWRNSWTLIFPAVVYTVQNNLSFIALSYIPATEFQLLAQFKTLTTALFSVLFLGTRLSRIQWMALCLLVIGVMLAQLPAPGHSSVKSMSVSQLHSAVDLSAASSEGWVSDHTFGVLAVLFLSVLSGAAGVYQEKVVKHYIDLSIHYLNMQLAVLSFFTNAISIMLQDREAISDKGFFHGYSALVWTIICVSSLGGILVAVVIRYTSNLAKSYAISFTIFITSIISYYYVPETTNLSLQWLLAAVVVVISVLLYIDPAAAAPPVSPVLSATPGGNVDKADKDLEAQSSSSSSSSTSSSAHSSPKQLHGGAGSSSGSDDSEGVSVMVVPSKVELSELQKRS